MDHSKELIKIQGKFGKNLTEYYTNFKKEGKRLNKIERLTYWREKLDAEWVQFLSNHRELTEITEDLNEENYFKEAYFVSNYFITRCD